MQAGADGPRLGERSALVDLERNSPARTRDDRGEGSFVSAIRFAAAKGRRLMPTVVCRDIRIENAMTRLRHSAVALLASTLGLAACGSAGSDSPGGPTNIGDDAGAGDGASGNDAQGYPPGGSSSCSIARSGTVGLVLRGRLLLPSGPIDGELLMGPDGTIACADASCASHVGYGSATVIACGASVIAPGLINAHDHTEYDWNPPLPHGQTRWQHRNGWRKGTNGEPALVPTPMFTNDVKLIAAAETRFLVGGTTTVNGSGGVAGLVRNAADSTTLEGLKSNSVYFDTFPLGDSSGVELASGCGYPKIRSATSAFKGGAYTPHISEGINAAAENEFACLEGSLVTDATGIIHGVGLTATDVNSIAKAGAKVIWSARTNIDLYGNTAPVTLLKTMGVTIALGTDWLASGSMNMLRELACVDSLNTKYFDRAFDDRAIVDMATMGSAQALKLDSELGSLAVGKFADIAVFAAANGREDYRAVIDAAPQDVTLVLRGGKALFGDAAVVDALSPGCGDLPMCGTMKKLCVETPGVTIADIQAAAASSYPLFYCRGETPKDEPSCVPYRDSYPNGTSATDRDGDGIPDAMDDCPSVFNPVRPLDGATQSDSDGDGAGDACDAKPLDNSAH